MSGTILVVDDEPLVRRTLQRALERAGYRVLLAVDGASGLATLGAEARVDLLISDVMMDDMIGSALVAEARARHPEVAVLIMSGETPENLPGVGVDKGREHFLAKPFQPDDLLRTVAAILQP